jgi:UDP-N-acetylglucosamine 2-epimerase
LRRMWESVPHRPTVAQSRSTNHTIAMKIVSVVGARPQFVKAASICEALRRAGEEDFLLHTGQHYDPQMSQVFFDELRIPAPRLNLAVGSGTHGWQTAQMLTGIERVLEAEHPNFVIVYGDTNSTLAGALAACKLGIPVAHVEAGLRSHNRNMPEEHNRVLTDHCADLLFCPTQTAIENLAAEGITKGVFLVGDPMLDAMVTYGPAARMRPLLKQLALEPRRYLLLTVHRPANADNANRLEDILKAMGALDETVIFPVHPRTAGRLRDLGVALPGNVRLIEPVGYLDMLCLEQNARIVLTDSGGVQKEAFFFGVPCVTLRSETEWVETVDAGMNVIVGTDRDRIIEAVKVREPRTVQAPLLTGAGDRIVALLRQHCDALETVDEGA